MQHRRNKIWKIIFFIPMLLIGILFMSLLVMLLWNAILPTVLGVKAISFMQAAGIFILSKILFGFQGGRGQNWKRGIKGNWQNLTLEEKEKVKAEWKDRFSRFGSRWEKNTPSADGPSTTAQ